MNDQTMVAFKEAKLANVMKTVNNSNKTFDNWFGCIESIYQIKQDIQNDVLGQYIEESQAKGDTKKEDASKEELVLVNQIDTQKQSEDISKNEPSMQT